MFYFKLENHINTIISRMKKKELLKECLCDCFCYLKKSQRENSSLTFNKHRLNAHLTLNSN